MDKDDLREAVNTQTRVMIAFMVVICGALVAAVYFIARQ